MIFPKEHFWSRCLHKYLISAMILTMKIEFCNLAPKVTYPASFLATFCFTIQNSFSSLNSSCSFQDLTYVIPSPWRTSYSPSLSTSLAQASFYPRCFPDALRWVGWLLEAYPLEFIPPWVSNSSLSDICTPLHSKFQDSRVPAWLLYGGIYPSSTKVFVTYSTFNKCLLNWISMEAWRAISAYLMSWEHIHKLIVSLTKW